MTLMTPTNDTNDSVIFNSSTSKHFVLCDGLNIETIVTNKARVVEQWAQQVSSTHVPGSQMVVGLDTEWMFVGARWKTNMRTAILQLCVEDKCLIFQLHHMDYIPIALKNFMTHSESKFVGVGVEQDIKMLERDHLLKCDKGLDVATLAMTQWPNRFNSSPGLKKLAKELTSLYMKKSKKVQMSKWELKELTRDQIEYACIDAYASYKIGKKLLIDEGLTSTVS